MIYSDTGGLRMPRRWIVEETFDDQKQGSFDGFLYTREPGHPRFSKPGKGASIVVVKEITQEIDDGERYGTKN